jgi:hypothetical protein
MNAESLESGDKSGGAAKKSFENKNDIPLKKSSQGSPKQEAAPKQ